MNKHGEMSSADVKIEETTDYTDFHVKSHIQFDDDAYDQRLEQLHYSYLDFEYTVAMNVLNKMPKKYRDYTEQGKKNVATRKKNKALKSKKLMEELGYETLD